MKRGIISVSNDIYTNRYDLAKIIFNYMKPIRIDFEYWNGNVWRFVGESDLFDEIKEGESIPNYDAMLKTKEDGTVVFDKFARI